MADPVLSSNIGYFLLAILIATIISIFVTMSMSSKKSLESLIAEYSVMAGVLLLMTALIIMNLRSAGLSLFSFESFITLFPFVWLLFIIAYFISLLTIYFDRIAGDKVSSYYNTFSGLLISLVIVQILMLVNSLIKSPGTPVIGKKTFSIMMLLGTINFIVVITLGIILKFYATDC